MRKWKMDMFANEQSVLKRVKRAQKFLKLHGILGTLRILVQESLGLPVNVSPSLNDASPTADRYNEFLHLPSIQPLKQRENAISFVIPMPGKGSGGHTTIFRMIQGLENAGFTVTVHVYGVKGSKIAERNLKKQTLTWYPRVEAEIKLGLENVHDSDFFVATNWLSAYWVKAIESTAKKIYFVQDFEPWFYERNSYYFFAENTYKFGFAGITAGKFLESFLNENYGMETKSIDLAPHRSNKKEPIKGSKDRQRLFLYARPETGRRGFELALNSLEIAKRSLPNLEVWIAGSDHLAITPQFKHRNFGVVSESVLEEIYRRCDASLILSLTNVSLMPLELMASGIPVISNGGKWVEWLLNEKNCFLVDLDPELMAQAIVRVLLDSKLQESLRTQGYAQASKTTWSKESSKFAEIFRGYQNVYK